MVVAATCAALGAVLFVLGFLLPPMVGWWEARRSSVRRRPSPLPANASVDVIVPAYLEVSTIGAKIASVRTGLAALPGATRVVVVADDPDTARAAADADLVIEGVREGKSVACNTGVAQSRADVVVFTDANCEIVPPSWGEELLRELGEWHLVSAQKRERGGMDGLFWRLEHLMKSGASTTVGTLAVAGEFMAMRRTDYEPLPRGVVLDDLGMATHLALQGLSVTSSPRFSTIEDAATGRDQWERRVRITAALLADYVPQLGTLMTIPVGRVFVAHKLYRVTLGCLGYLLCVLGVSALWPPWSLVVLALAVYGALGYAGRVPLPRVLAPFGAVAGMQAVPVVAALRCLDRRVRRERAEADALWQKVGR